MKPTFPLVLSALTIVSHPAYALILAGPNGTGSGNATEATLAAHLTSQAAPAFPYWNSVLQVSDASGVYLGNGWVMTAAHVNQLVVGSGTITVAGTPYVVRQNTQVGAQDIRLYQIGSDPSDPPLPLLPSISLDLSSPALSQSFLTFGRSSRTEGTANLATSSDASLAGSPSLFDWGSPGTVRWGGNNVELIPSWTGAGAGPYAISGGNTVFTSTFDDPGSGNYLNALEAGHAVGDSGGPVFTLNGSIWELSAMAISVAADPAASQPANTTNFGNLSVYIDLATYKAAIEAIAIPEPSVSLLAGLGAIGLLIRRRPPTGGKRLV